MHGSRHLRLNTAGLTALALSLALLAPFSSAYAWSMFGNGGKDNDKSGRSDVNTKPVPRNFLPPVATINGPLQENTEATTNSGGDSDAVEFNATGDDQPQIKLHGRPDHVDSALAVQDTSQLQLLSEKQQDLDKADCTTLLNATVERNPVIQFALKKVQAPPELRPSTSSQFYKRMASTLVIASTQAAGMFMPLADYYSRMGAAAAGQAINNVITGENKPHDLNPLSDTERIQLTQLLQDINSDLLENYHNYKNTLLLLAQNQQSVITKNNEYSKALQSGNAVAIMATATAYYKAEENDTQLRQQAKFYRMKLERMAGVDAVSDLQLALFSPEQPVKATATKPGKIGKEKPGKPGKDKTDQLQPLIPPGNLVDKSGSDKTGPQKDDAIAVPAVSDDKPFKPELSTPPVEDGTATPESNQQIGPPMPVTADDFRMLNEAPKTDTPAMPVLKREP